MSPELAELANRIQQQPWNRPGCDKTWVLEALAQYRKFQDEIRRASGGGAR
jgi:hypothetical protein